MLGSGGAPVAIILGGDFNAEPDKPSIGVVQGAGARGVQELARVDVR